MAYFRVQLHGTDITLDGADGGPPIVGFYTTRIVRAASQQDAAKAAAQSVTEQWSNDPSYTKNNRGTLPTLTVEWVKPDTFLGSLFFRGVGHTFYPAEPSA
jgi:hypothetical protein